MEFSEFENRRIEKLVDTFLRNGGRRPTCASSPLPSFFYSSISTNL